MQIVEAGTPLTELDIRRFEKETGFRLPSDYRAFLAEHNGGRPLPSAFRLQGGTEASVADWFFCISGPHACYRFSWILEVFAERLPDGLLPIACDPFGNLICIWCAGPNIGQIEFWDHELEAEEGELPTMENLSPVAASFREFVDGLYELQPGEVE